MVVLVRRLPAGLAGGGAPAALAPATGRCGDGSAGGLGLDPLCGVGNSSLLSAHRYSSGRSDLGHLGGLLADGGVWDLDAGLIGDWLPDDGGVWGRSDDLLGRRGSQSLGVVVCAWNPVGDWVVDSLGLIDFSGLLVDGALSAKLGGAGG